MIGNAGPVKCDVCGAVCVICDKCLEEEQAEAASLVNHRERSIDMLLNEFVDDASLRESLRLLLKYPGHKPTPAEIEYGKSLGPVAGRLLGEKRCLSRS